MAEVAELHLRNFAAVAYDFDGTIKDSVADHERARQLAFDVMAETDERFAAIDPAIFAEAHKHGSNPPAIIGWTLEQSGIVADGDPALDPLTQQTVQFKRRFYRELCAQGGVPIAGALQFIRQMSVERPGKEYIVTTAERQTEVIPFLIRHKLTRHFPDVRIVGHEDVDQLKPAPQAYQIMLERAGLGDAPERALAIEDSTQGITAAKLAGLTVVGVATTHAADELMSGQPALRPDLIVPDFPELGGLLLPRGY